VLASFFRRQAARPFLRQQIADLRGTDYATKPRLAKLSGSGANRIAVVATLSEIPSLGPVWLRLRSTSPPTTRPANGSRQGIS